MPGYLKEKVSFENVAAPILRGISGKTIRLFLHSPRRNIQMCVLEMSVKGARYPRYSACLSTNAHVFKSITHQPLGILRRLPRDGTDKRCSPHNKVTKCPSSIEEIGSRGSRTGVLLPRKGEMWDV